MECKQFFKPTTFKVFFTIILTLTSEIFVYIYGKTGYIILTEPTPPGLANVGYAAAVAQPNPATFLIMLSLIPLLFLFYSLSAVILEIKSEGIKTHLAKSGNWSFLYLIILLPFAYPQLESMGLYLGFSFVNVFFDMSVSLLTGTNFGGWPAYYYLEYPLGGLETFRSNFNLTTFYFTAVSAALLFIVLFLIISKTAKKEASK